jgi:hypothetical protein
MISNAISPVYECTFCNTISISKKDYKRHLITRKHQKLENSNGDSNVSNGFQSQISTKSPKSPLRKCVTCDKTFLSNSGLWYHKKKCIISGNKEELDKNKIILELLNQNNELYKLIAKQNETTNTIAEMMPKIGNTTNNTNNISIKIFLNEKCKEAITMDEFVNKMNISLPDLMYTKEKGLVEGLSNIFIENLNMLPIHQRPIHCTDVKREIIYIKNDKWEKDENKTQTKNAIKKLSSIQIKNLKKFKEQYPDCMKNDKHKDTYMELIKATTDDISGKEDKIIKNLCKNIYINDKIIN